MKLASGINLLSSRNIEKKLSKKITHANTADKQLDPKVLKKAQGASSDPLYFQNSSEASPFNPDIRYRANFAYSPLTGINYRNDLLVFAENNEVKKAVGIVANETVIIDTEVNKYPVFPKINQVLISEEKQKLADAIQDYLDKVFYPKLYNWYNFKDDGLIEVVKEFLITGKIAYEIIYDSLKNPKDIIGLQPIDPATIQKFKENDLVFYVQRTMISANGSFKERILHENQVILIEWNKFDFGYISYVDKLRRSFNTMRSMNTSKVLWFAAKSQVRMHIKLALGDVVRTEAIAKLSQAKNDYINTFSFDDDGRVMFNNMPNNNGYREFFTAETAGSGHPEIEEISANGPDLSETESLNYWAKLFWQDTEIPYDRIDPNAGETWGFTDVNNLRKVELNFSKFINGIRKMLNELFIKPIIIQLTLKETEIGVDMDLLDSIKIDWIAFNEYDKLAELEVLNKKVELAQNLSQFGEYTDANGNTRKAIPTMWITKTFLDFTKEQLDNIEEERRKEEALFNTQEGSEDELALEEESDETMMEDEDVPPIIQSYENGELTDEDIAMLIDNNQLSDEDIQALKDAGIYPEEDGTDIMMSEEW